jgi:hypothetical protein
MGSCFASYLVIPRGLNLSGRSKLRSRGEKAGKPSLSPAVVDFFRRSSSIFWRASYPPCEAPEAWMFVWPQPPRLPPPPALLLAPWLELPSSLPPPSGSRPPPPAGAR